MVGLRDSVLNRRLSLLGDEWTGKVGFAKEKRFFYPGEEPSSFQLEKRRNRRVRIKVTNHKKGYLTIKYEIQIEKRPILHDVVYENPEEL